jgi:hypothetical protein
MQTIYLEKESGVTITRDGPALVVKAEGEAARLFPLARLGRVVLHKTAEISSRVLIECAQAGVVFCFTDKRRNPIAWCLQQQDSGSNMASAWREFIGRTDWSECFLQWKKRQLEKALEQDIASLKIDGEGRELSQLMHIIEHWGVRLAGEESADFALKWMESEIQGVLVQVLQQRGVSEVDIVSLAAALTTIVRWRLEAARIQWLHLRFTRAKNKYEKTAAITRVEFLGFLEKNKANLNAVSEALVESLYYWLQLPE